MNKVTVRILDAFDCSSLFSNFNEIKWFCWVAYKKDTNDGTLTTSKICWFWSMSLSPSSSSNPSKSSGKSISSVSCSLKHSSSLNCKHDTQSHRCSRHVTLQFQVKSIKGCFMHSGISSEMFDSIWAFADMFLKYVFIVMFFLKRCLHFDWKNIIRNYISSQHILCAKTWHSIDDSFAMTCSIMRSNNSQVEFLGQLLKKNKGDFIFALRRCIVTLDPKIFILDFIYRSHIS